MLGRAHKAAAIADFLIGKSFTAADVKTGLDDEAAWKLLAKEMGAKIASAETRKLVVECMERAERIWEGAKVNDASGN